jgi:hypothetical protein
MQMQCISSTTTIWMFFCVLQCLRSWHYLGLQERAKWALANTFCKEDRNKLSIGVTFVTAIALSPPRRRRL